MIFERLFFSCVICVYELLKRVVFGFPSRFGQLVLEKRTTTTLELVFLKFGAKLVILDEGLIRHG